MCALWPPGRQTHPIKAVTARSYAQGATTYGRQDYGGADYTHESPRVGIRSLRVAVRRTAGRVPTTTANQALGLRSAQRPVATAVTGRAAMGPLRNVGYAATRRRRRTHLPAPQGSIIGRGRTPSSGCRHRCVHMLGQSGTGDACSQT